METPQLKVMGRSVMEELLYVVVQRLVRQLPFIIMENPVVRMRKRRSDPVRKGIGIPVRELVPQWVSLF